MHRRREQQRGVDVAVGRQVRRSAPAGSWSPPARSASARRRPGRPLRPFPTRRQAPSSRRRAASASARRVTVRCCRSKPLSSNVIVYWPGRQQREDVVAVLGCDGGANALQVRRLHAHRHARHRAAPARRRRGRKSFRSCSARTATPASASMATTSQIPNLMTAHRMSSQILVSVVDGFQSMTARSRRVICADFDHDDRESL